MKSQSCPTTAGKRHGFGNVSYQKWFAKEYAQILTECKIGLVKKHDEAGSENERSSNKRTDKTGYTIALIEKLRRTSADGTRVPRFFAKIIRDVISKAAT